MYRDVVNNWAEKVKSAGGTIISEPQDYEKDYTLVLLIRMVTTSIFCIGEECKLNHNIIEKEMNTEIKAYNEKQASGDKDICDQLATIIDNELTEAESKIWHAHPVWFLDGNPIVGYSKQKAGLRLMFWSGADFDEESLNVKGQKFKDASIFYPTISEIEVNDLKRWLKKSRDIQWDYKNILKRKGQLERLK
ncbi:Domain of unknown function DUF1801 [Flavobacteriaceae bacterium]|jgi:uncharacterized protein YdhG (YjbR/CyaY superfamily)